jgi:hypothetical protein
VSCVSVVSFLVAGWKGWDVTAPPPASRLRLAAPVSGPSAQLETPQTIPTTPSFPGHGGAEPQIPWAMNDEQWSPSWRRISLQRIESQLVNDSKGGRIPVSIFTVIVRFTSSSLSCLRLASAEWSG